jgi:hypothetical protein
MAAIPVAFKRTAAALLLAGFLTQAADGLMAALCPPSAGEGAPVSTVIFAESMTDRDHAGPAGEAPDPHAAGHGEGAEPGHSDHESTCPFGGAAIMACGGAPTAPSPAPSTRSPAPAAFLLAVPEPATGAGTLLVSDMFRPPRG